MEMHIISKTYGMHIIYFDVEDWNKIKNYSWHLKAGVNTMYATTHVFSGSIRTSIDMHRLIMKPDVGMYVDHISGNGLDNRRCNLRICTNAENVRNRVLFKNNKTGYKGVTFKNKIMKFVANIRIDGKQTHLGCFNSVIDAARAYNKAAIKNYGKFAKLNTIREA